VTRPLARRLLAEFLGSAFLAAVVIGSGIAAQNLSHDTGIRLLENAAATAAGLYAIILMFGPVSGGHFNPVVSLVDAAFGGLSRRDALAYVPVQLAGCIAGAIAANGMFALAAISISDKHRASPAHLLAEVIATVGLILVIFALARNDRIATAPAAVGAYIGAAYWFTSSTSFANPPRSASGACSPTRSPGSPPRPYQGSWWRSSRAGWWRSAWSGSSIPTSARPRPKRSSSPCRRDRAPSATTAR
jgi:glycerol uptake facilitator-like aquaporin